MSEKEEKTLRGGSGIEGNDDFLTSTQSFRSGTSEVIDKVNWEIGDVIDGKYEVLKILGQGSMGIVYKVHHRGWDLDLAVKMALPHLVANEVSKVRFIREAQTWVDLGLHPNIVQCWYVRELGGIPRVFMDYLDGGSLKDWMRKGKVKPGEWDKILDLVIQACDGLGYAHEHGVEAYRDVKPANLLLTKKGDLRVTDFSIAKHQGNPDVEGKIITVSSGGAPYTVTITGSDLGTPEYSAPEQWGEAKHADPRADIYALGSVLFELCCGRRPFDDGIHREPPSVLIGRHLFTPAPDPRKFKKDIPTVLAELILWCLEKKPDDRPRSMGELREKLVEIHEQVIGTPYKRTAPQAVKLRSNALNNRAVSLLDIGRKEEAFAVLAEALTLDPHHAESVYNKALLEWREEKIADDEVVRRLKEVKQASWRAGLYLGFVHVERAAADEAEKELTEALQHYELAKDSSVWRALGDMRMAQEKYSEADEAYQKALELIPRDSTILQRRMLAQQRTRKQNGRVMFPWPRCFRTFVGYKYKPDALTLTSDGRFAILGTSDEMRLWDLTTGRFFWRFLWSENVNCWTFKGYANSMTTVAITPDEKFGVWGGSTDPSVQVWDLTTGQCLRILKGHERGVTTVAVTPDGKCALSGSLDKTLRLWDLTTGNCLQILTGHESSVAAVAITPDGKFALSGGGKTLRLWDLATGKHLRNFSGHKDPVTSVIVSPDGRFAVSGSQDKTLRVWDLAVGKCSQVFVGHTGSVTTVAITPDGRLAVSGSRDGTLRIWNLATGRCLRILKGHRSGVTTVAITPDGRLAVSGSRDKTLRVWSLRTGKCLRTFKGFTYWLETIAVMPNGRFAIVGNSDELRLQNLKTGTYCQTFKKWREHEMAVTVRSERQSSMSGGKTEVLRLWDVPPGEGFLTIKGQKDAGMAVVAVTPDGRFAISGSQDATLRLWDLVSGECLWIFKGQRGLQVFKKSKNWMSDVTVTPDDRFAVSGWYDTSLRVWDLSTGECLQTLKGHNESVTVVAVTPDGRFIVSGSFDKTLRLWDRTKGECLQILEGHEGIVTAVVITPDGRFAVSGSTDKTLRLWDLTTGKCLRTFEGHEESIIAVAVTPDGEFALSLGADKTLRLWLLDAEVQHHKAVLQVCRHRDYLELQTFRERFRKHLDRAKFAKKSGKIATAYMFLSLARATPGYERDAEALALNVTLSGILQKKSLQEGRLLRVLEGHKDSVTAVAVTPDGRFALSGSRDKTVRLWNLITGQCIRIFEGHTGSVSCVTITPDRHLGVSGSWDKTLRLWALATGECLKTFNKHGDSVKTVAVTPDGRFAISGSSDKTLRLWSLATEKYLQIFEGLAAPLEDAYKSAELATNKCLRTFRGHKEDVNAVAVTPNGFFAVSGGRDKALRVWDLKTGHCLRILSGHEDYVTAVAITADGRFVISGSRDKTLRLWNLATGKCFRIFRGHENYVTAVTVTSDRRFAISGSWDKTLRLWRLRTGECLRIFERHEENVESVAMTPDGRFAISGGRDTTLQVWEFDWRLTPHNLG